MKSSIAVSIAVVALLLAGIAFTMAAMRDPGPSAGSAEDRVGAMARRLDSLEIRLEALETIGDQIGDRVDELAGRIAGAEKKLEEAGSSLALGGNRGAAPDAGPESSGEPGREDSAADAELERERMLDEALSTLTDPTSDRDAHEKTWEALRIAGLVDDAISFFEERARANPQDADAQSQLGTAYLQKLVTAKQAEMAGWAMKADEQFDKALAVNPQHWDARFQKAMSYSFWPPIFGYQDKAIAEFETLIAQQEEAAISPEHFASSYLLLGNLHSTRGEAAKAQDVWSRGAERFPQSEELTAKVASGTKGGASGR